MTPGTTPPQHPAYAQRRQVTAHAAVVLAPNPSAMTLDGTNTWLLGADATASVVVDPGPADPPHLETVLQHAGRIEHIVLTHHHDDHRGNLAALAERTGAPVSALDPAVGPAGTRRVADGDRITAAGVDVQVVATPGHTADSLCLVLDGDEAVLTGDTVLGRGTTVIAHPDGDLGAYLDSLAVLQALGPLPVLPGHGAERANLAETAQRYLAHRLERLEQIRAALAALDLEPDDANAPVVVARVYADVDRTLWPAAEWSVRAQLAHLRTATKRLP